MSEQRPGERVVQAEADDVLLEEYSLRQLSLTRFMVR